MEYYDKSYSLVQPLPAFVQKLILSGVRGQGKRNQKVHL